MVLLILLLSPTCQMDVDLTWNPSKHSEFAQPRSGFGLPTEAGEHREEWKRQEEERKEKIMATFKLAAEQAAELQWERSRGFSSR